METKTRAGLTWEDCLDDASDAIVAQVEQRLGIRFPSDYLDVAKACQGARPIERRRFVFHETPQGGPEWSGLSYMLPFDPAHEEGILSTIDGLAIDDQLPGSVVPIATDGGGDYVCLDYRSGGAPAIVYWSHEADPDESIFPLAATFTEFLARLEPPRQRPVKVS